MTLSGAEKKIVDTVTVLSDDICQFTCDLVAQPSTLGNEAGAVAVMEEKLSRLGYTPTRVPIDYDTLKDHPGFAPVTWEYTGKDNVLTKIEPAVHKGKSLLFNGHLDVVSAEPAEYWEQDPYVPRVEEGWIHGRGAGDMKSGVAAMTYAAYAIRKAGFELAAPLTVEGVIEEECCGNGALACVNAGYDADAVLIPEPFGPSIYTCQVGVMWFKVKIKGRPVHVLRAGKGANSIEKMFPLIQALRGLEEEMNKENVPPQYENFEHPLNLNIGIVRGGDWASTVPAACEFHGRLSYYPGTEYKDVCARIEACVRDTAAKDPWLRENPPQVIFYGFRSDGHCVDRNLEAFQVLNDCHRNFFNQEAKAYISTCTTDLRAFHFFGSGQATCYGPHAENIHGTNEKVDIDSIIHTAKTYALFAARWCQLAGS